MKIQTLRVRAFSANFHFWMNYFFKDERQCLLTWIEGTICMIALYSDFDRHPQVNLIAVACGRGSGALIWKDVILLCMCVCVCVCVCVLKKVWLLSLVFRACNPFFEFLNASGRERKRVWTCVLNANKDLSRLFSDEDRLVLIFYLANYVKWSVTAYINTVAQSNILSARVEQTLKGISPLSQNLCSPESQMSSLMNLMCTLMKQIWWIRECWRNDVSL